MRKINTTKLMAVLASLCLATSPFAGSTLAKYITTATSNDDARVSTFGVVLQADGNLFGEDYIDNIEVGKDSTTLAVQASAVARENVVAPGTKNDAGLHFSVTGKPEVATRLEAEITVENIFLRKDALLDLGFYIGTVNNASINEYMLLVPVPLGTMTEELLASDTKVVDDETVSSKYYYFDSAKNIYTSAPASFGASNDANTQYYTGLQFDVSFADKNIYYPIVYKSAGKTDGTIEADSLTAIAADYADKLAGKGLDTPNVNYEIKTSTSNGGKTTTYKVVAEYPPNFDYSELGLANESLTWEWDYDDNGNGTCDDADTVLGLLMAKNSLPAGSKLVRYFGSSYNIQHGKATYTDMAENAYNLNTNFSIKITSTQLDRAITKPTIQ